MICLKMYACDGYCFQSDLRTFEEISHKKKYDNNSNVLLCVSVTAGATEPVNLLCVHKRPNFAISYDGVINIQR